MAALVDSSTGQCVFLHAHHSFGRLTYSVDTVIARQQISKHHAIIEWYNDSWLIRDLSSNGTWLNQQKLEQNRRYPLKIDDTIGFAQPQGEAFLVVDLSPPADMLIPKDITVATLNHVIYLQQYHLLPNEQAPELAVIFDSEQQRRRIEWLDCPDNLANNLYDNDVISFANRNWQLKLSHMQEQTQQLASQEQSLDELVFTFDVSLDEETTELRLQAPEQVIDLAVRSHHYLTLSLARQKAADVKDGVDKTSQGWVYADDLAKDLGIDLSHLNIQIHRIRKQFTDSLNNILDSERLIERKGGKLRFGASKFTINKAQRLEAQLS